MATLPTLKYAILIYRVINFIKISNFGEYIIQNLASFVNIYYRSYKFDIQVRTCSIMLYNI